MRNTGKEKEIIERLIQWAEHQPLVRAMLLTSSRAIPSAPGDVFSDYDVILVVREVHPFYEDRAWLEAFGSVLVVYRDPLESHDGFLKSAYVTQYENGSKLISPSGRSKSCNESRPIRTFHLSLTPVIWSCSTRIT